MKLLPICNAITRLGGGGKCTSAAKYPAARSVSHTQTYFTSRLQSVMSFDFASKKKSGSNCLVLIGDTLLPLCFQCCFILCCTTSAQTQPDSAKLCCLSNHPELLESFFFSFFNPFFNLPLRSSPTAGCLGCLCKENCRGRRKITAVGDNERVTWLDLSVAWCDRYQSVDE